MGKMWSKTKVRKTEIHEVVFIDRLQFDAFRFANARPTFQRYVGPPRPRVGTGPGPINQDLMNTQRIEELDPSSDEEFEDAVGNT